MATVKRRKIRLRDIDNRGDDMAPYEFEGSTETVIGYLNGPLRRDSTPDAHHQIDEAIEFLKQGRVTEAAKVIGLGIDLQEA